MLARLLGPLTVSAMVSGLCVLVPAPALAQCTISASGVGFGEYDVFTPAPTDSTGTVTYECHGSVREVRVTLSPGSGTFAARTLRRAAETLQYNLYLDAARTQVWGDGTAGTDFYFRRNAPPKPQFLTVYGRIEPQQDVGIGAYVDALIVAIDF